MYGCIKSKREFKALGKKSRKFVKRFIISETPLKVCDNAIFSKEEILSSVVTASVNLDYLEGNTRVARAFVECPTADDVFYHLGKMDPYEVAEKMNKALVKSVRLYRDRNFFPHQVYCALDVHDIPYYGDRKKAPVRGTKRKAGTNFAHSFITLNIVENGRRFAVALLPYLPLDDKVELVEKLVMIAEKVITIKALFMDRDFPSVEMLLMLDRTKVKYLMAVPRFKGVKKLLKRKRKFPFFTEYEMQSSTGTAKTTLFVVKKKSKDRELKYCYITNMKIESVEDALKFSELYRIRWGIETSYRVKKEFRVKTTSRKYVARLLFFSYSVLLYNIWVLCNFLGVEEVVFLGPRTSAKIIKTITYLTYCGFFGE